MTYQEIKEDAIALHNKATRIENGEEMTSARLQKKLNEDEVKIVSEFLSSISGDELNAELDFILDNINIEDSHTSILVFMINYKDYYVNKYMLKK
jgi:hypothetical protein